MRAKADLEFRQKLESSNTEEDVKYAYANFFDIKKYDTSDKNDLYTKSVIFEFKYDKNFENIKVRATVLAQTLYYIRRLKYSESDKPIPPIICLADKNEAILTETVKWKKYFSDDKNKYDWDLAPSSPDEKLIKELSENDEIRKIHIYKIQNQEDLKLFSERLTDYLDENQKLPIPDLKVITETNFEIVYHYWNEIFGESVRNGFKTSKYFVCDIQDGRTIIDRKDGKVIFNFPNDKPVSKKIFLKDYDYYWSIYQRVSNKETIRDIIAKIDRLTDESMRRFYGEFFTPVKFAKKGLDYIEKVIGKNWWESGEYRLWDMAAGTGNLQYHLPVDALKYCYLSTIYKEDVDHCRKLFSKATCFQYDYLNDDAENLFLDNGFGFSLKWKLPPNLQKDLKDTKLKWIILINPPFATSQEAGTNQGSSKKGVSDTQIRKLMHKENLGEVSRELFAQFLFRIKKEFENKKVILGLFSKIKYLSANNDQKFRDTFFHFSFKKGFIFSSANFSGTSKSSQFPVGFLIWDLNKSKRLEEQTIEVDIFNENVEKIGTKKIHSENKERHLSKWIDRPEATIKFPPFGSSIEIKSENKDRRDRIAKGFIGSLMCKGNDFVNQNFTAILSGPYVSAGALSITPENFEKAMIIHAVRRIPKATWINDRDQFMIPTKELDEEFITDCTVWNLFSNSNQTVAMKDVKYEKEIYQIQNHFFPILLKDLKKWKIADSDIEKLLKDAENRFVAEWISKKSLSIEAEQVLIKGKEIYKFYFSHLNELNTKPYKIDTWDAGWWQIRNSLSEQNLGNQLFEEFKKYHISLRDKILPAINEYEFI